MKLLIAYATRKNSTKETAEFIGEIMSTRGAEVTVADCDDVANVREYDAVIVGTAVYTGEWLPAAETFLRKFGDEMAQKPFAYFMLCIRVLEADGYSYVMDEYVPHYLLQKMTNIVEGTVFAGRLYDEDIDWHERWTLSVRYEGAQDPLSINHDYRDWAEIRAWAHRLADRLAI
jgi:menaquinone-dependent protoporphyrinogen oxidase